MPAKNQQSAPRIDIHPALRRHRAPKQERCRACGLELLPEFLTVDGLCFACDKVVRQLERGII